MLPLFAQGSNQCLHLFENFNSPQILKIVDPQASKSFIYDSQWLIHKLFNEGWQKRLQNADPGRDHLSLLQDILLETQKELKDSIQREYLEPPAEVLEIYVHLSNSLAQGIRERRITLDFYTAYLKVVSYIFFDSQTVLFPNRYKVDPGAVRDDLLRPSKSSLGEIFHLLTLAHLDFYDFIYLWPDVHPEGIVMQREIKFEGKSNGDTIRFRAHDHFHSKGFMSAYKRLSALDRLEFREILKFVRSYKNQLNEQEQVIFSSVFFEFMHEVHDLNYIVQTFNDQSQLGSSTRKIMAKKLKEKAQTTYDRFQNPNDYGVAYALKSMDKNYFVNQTERIFKRVTINYQK